MPLASDQPFIPRVPMEQRLARRRRIDPQMGCWEWTGNVDANGYGRITINRRNGYVHRASWEVANATAIPQGHVIDHVCENRRCFNPDHLELVTYAENTNRRKNAQATRTHCPRGHRYAGTNLRVYVDKDGHPHRQCAVCSKEYSRAYRARRAGDVAS